MLCFRPDNLQKQGVDVYSLAVVLFSRKGDTQCPVCQSISREGGQSFLTSEVTEDLVVADEVKVYAKLPRGPRGFYIPTPVGKYSPDWAISFKKGSVNHIFFIVETKGSNEVSELRPIEAAKIICAKKLFNEISTAGVKYHAVKDYQSLLNEVHSL